MRSYLGLFAALILAACGINEASAQSIVTTTIPSGTATSGEVNLIPYLHVGQQNPVQIQMPSAWTTASLIFLVSNDGGDTFHELYDGNGNEYVVNAEANALILLDPNVFNYISVFEIESVNYSSPPSVPVNQAATRTLAITTTR
jgi:hypothetical protein